MKRRDSRITRKTNLDKVVDDQSVLAGEIAVATSKKKADATKGFRVHARGT